MSERLDTLVEKQQNIYLNAFKHPMAQPGLHLTGAERELESGLLVVIKYPAELVELLTQASLAIAAEIPAMLFTSNTLYSTVLVGPKLNRLSQDEARREELRFSNWFFERGLPIGREYRKLLSIQFTEWLYNSNTLIAASKANEAYWRLASLLHASANEAELSNSLPWGSHVSVSRFLAAQLPASAIQSTIAQLPPIPSKAVTPQGMELIHYECDSNGFRIRNSDFWNA